jgi:SAM-dependent methyltransferase
VRWRYYVDQKDGRIVAGMPLAIRDRIGLGDETAIGSRRIEVGSGPYAQAGYLHVDVDPRAGHVEAITPAWQLPFPDAWATEVLAIHSLEHIPPPKLLETLREWRRVLVPAGRVRIHVPNGPGLFKAFQDSPVEGKWAIMGSILGMYCAPDANCPEDLTVRSDHQLIFDLPLLTWALTAAGFRDVKDLTDAAEDRHILAWRNRVRRYSLVVTAAR